MALKLKETFHIPVNSITVEACGPDFDKTVWYHGTFEMWGASFFVELYRVCDIHGSDFEQFLDKRVEGADYAEWERDFDALVDLHQPDGGFQTVNIDGDEFVLIIYPMSAS